MRLARDLRALVWITASLIRRYLREPHVVRSLIWPIAIGPVTIVLTVLVFVWLEGDWPIAIDDGTPPDIVALIEREGFVGIEVPDARQAVASGRYNLGTDGHTVYAAADRGLTLELERILRTEAGAPWRAGKPREPEYSPEQGARVTGIVGCLFVLFGVVLGAGTVARDRDDGTLEAELALGVGRWVHGTGRLLAGSLVLVVHFALAIAVFNALMGIEQPLALLRVGIGACVMSVTIGLTVIGRGGLKSGFSGPLAAGIAAATAMAAVGVTRNPLAAMLPIASLIAGGDGWLPLLSSGIAGMLAVVLFTIRSARA